jgi:glyoxylase-like metal-dependent hydrolase (beta-lactamase superfamily II)
LEISTGVHLIEATKGSYVYLVLGEEPVLVDTGFRGRADRILAELASIGVGAGDIAHIALTHHDIDHVGNAAALAKATGAKVWASSEDRAIICGEQKPRGLRGLMRAVAPVSPPPINAVYATGAMVGGLEVLPTPGHTRGHVSLRLGDILFSGDLVTSRGGRLAASPRMLTEDRLALQRSLREVGRLPFQLVCPAHGEPIVRGSLWEALVGEG